jgi:hypothetical protein
MTTPAPKQPEEDSTLGEVVDYVAWGADNGGVRCPCCDQWSQVYDRRINSGMARTLIRFYQAHGTEWGHLRSSDDSREGSKLRYWGLIENEAALRPDGGRSGWWRITPAGQDFVRGRLRVAKKAIVYGNEVLRMDDTTGTVDIHDSLGTEFNYSELMAGTGG